MIAPRRGHGRPGDADRGRPAVLRRRHVARHPDPARASRSPTVAIRDGLAAARPRAPLRCWPAGYAPDTGGTALLGGGRTTAAVVVALALRLWDEHRGPRTCRTGPWSGSRSLDRETFHRRGRRLPATTEPGRRRRSDARSEGSRVAPTLLRDRQTGTLVLARPPSGPATAATVLRTLTTADQERRAAAVGRRPGAGDRDRMWRPTPPTSPRRWRRAPAGPRRPAHPDPANGWPPSSTPPRDVAELPDPVGEVVRGYRLPNGLEVRAGARPHGCGGHDLRGPAQRHRGRRRRCASRAGNAALLRGSSSACATNPRSWTCMREALDG